MTLKASLPAWRDLFSRSMLPFLIELNHLVSLCCGRSGLIHKEAKQWCGSVMEWEHPDAKDVLHGLAWLRDTIKGQRRKRIEMVRQNDPFWDYVQKLDDGPFKCKFCGCKFAAATSISRFKWHLSGVKGRGVKICDKVPEQVSRRSPRRFKQ